MLTNMESRYSDAPDLSTLINNLVPRYPFVVPVIRSRLLSPSELATNLERDHIVLPQWYAWYCSAFLLKLLTAIHIRGLLAVSLCT